MRIVFEGSVWRGKLSLREGDITSEVERASIGGAIRKTQVRGVG